jgi:hypothetical protein
VISTRTTSPHACVGTSDTLNLVTLSLCSRQDNILLRELLEIILIPCLQHKPELEPELERQLIFTMTSKSDSHFKYVRQFLRYVTIFTFPAALLLSLPYAFTPRHSYYDPNTDPAPAIGLTILFPSLVLALVDTGLANRWLIRGFARTDYEYRIVLPTDTKEQHETKRYLKEIFIFCADFLLLVGIAIILGFTMSELGNGQSVMLVVYAALPYFFAG